LIGQPTLSGAARFVLSLLAREISSLQKALCRPSRLTRVELSLVVVASRGCRSTTQGFVGTAGIHLRTMSPSPSRLLYYRRPRISARSSNSQSRCPVACYRLRARATGSSASTRSTSSVCRVWYYWSTFLVHLAGRFLSLVTKDASRLLGLVSLLGLRLELPQSVLFSIESVRAWPWRCSFSQMQGSFDPASALLRVCQSLSP